jgi:hypothetical protein
MPSKKHAECLPQDKGQSIRTFWFSALRRARAIGDNPDYELQAYLGPNLGIFTPEGNVYVSSLIDDFGLCGIQGGNVLGFAHAHAGTGAVFQFYVFLQSFLSNNLRKL